jgi:hypothetical protein
MVKRVTACRDKAKLTNHDIENKNKILDERLENARTLVGLAMKNLKEEKAKNKLTKEYMK